MPSWARGLTRMPCVGVPVGAQARRRPSQRLNPGPRPLAAPSCQHGGPGRAGVTGHILALRAQAGSGAHGPQLRRRLASATARAEERLGLRVVHLSGTPSRFLA